MENTQKGKVGRPAFPYEQKKIPKSYYLPLLITDFISLHAKKLGKSESDVVVSAIRESFKGLEGFPQ